MTTLATPARPTASGSRSARRHRLARALLTAVLGLLSLPASAGAHGAPNPTASSYVAAVGRAPAGLDAQVVDGDQQLWLHVAAGLTVTVFDERGAPYLRFSRSGVQVNHNSSMYYLNLLPVALPPPANLTRSTPPDWRPASHGHAYRWHDGRLHALATVALASGTRYVGRWSVPLLVGARRAAITGPVWHAPAPSVVWFWPIAVLLACTLAAWRVRRSSVDLTMARVLAVLALAGVAAAAVGRDLHGRPTVPAMQLVELTLVLAGTVWGLRRTFSPRPGYFAPFLIGLVAFWQGLALLPTLLHGFTLLAVPPFAARVAAVVCLGAGASLLAVAPRLPARRPARRRRPGANPAVPTGPARPGAV